MVNIAVLVSGGGTNLQALIDAEKRGEIRNGHITAVISSIPTLCPDPGRAGRDPRPSPLPGRTLAPPGHDRGAGGALKELDIGLVIMAGFMVIITEELVSAYPNAILNIHPSLIPSFCGKGCYGLHVHEKALEYGVKVSGATVHFVSEECDGRPHRAPEGCGGAGR